MKLVFLALIRSANSGPDHFDAAIGLDKSLKALGMDYVDL